MEAKNIRPNMVVWCERYGKLGQVLKMKGFMCLMLFVGGECVWLPSSELGYIYD